MRTAIKFPVSADVEFDTSGYESPVFAFSEPIPANSRSATRTEQVAANQMGYSVSRVFDVIADAYNGQSFLVDETDGYMYDVKRVHQKDGSRIISIEGIRRHSGNGVLGW